MIVDLPDTDTAKVNAALVDLRKTGGAVALGRVLTLVVAVEESTAEAAITAANTASREHPCRILVLARGSKRGASRLDAQVRVGGDAGASEVVVLRLYGRLADHGDAVVVPLLLPDAPVVAWWPGEPPTKPSADPIGRLAHRRITDVAATRRPAKALDDRREDYTPGDTDMTWTRVTAWRAMLAAALDQPPHERVQRASVIASADSASGELLAGWLALQLRCPVTRHRTRAPGVSEVRMTMASGEVVLSRPDGVHAVLLQPGQPDRHLALPRRSTDECLAEELRRLDPDDVYAEVLTRGIGKVATGSPRAVPTGRPASGRGRATRGPARGRDDGDRPADPSPGPVGDGRRARRRTTSPAPASPAAAATVTDRAGSDDAPATAESRRPSPVRRAAAAGRGRVRG